MERRYRAVTLRRNRQKKRAIMFILLLLLSLKAIVSCGDYLKNSFFEQIIHLTEPNILQYTEYKQGVTEHKPAPFLMYMFTPSVLSFTKNSMPVDIVKPVAPKTEVVQAQHVTVSLDYEQQLSLLQENLQTLEGEDFTYYKEIEQAPSVSPIQQNGDLSMYQDFEKLVKDFYVVDASTSVNSGDFNIESLMEFDCSIEKNTEGPQILIYHSHGSEDYVDSIPGDPSTTIIGAGDRLTELLEGYGFSVMHHVAYYDKPSRDYAYTNALPEIEQILEENPTITTVIDLHRDGVADDVRLVKNIDGKDCARFMFFNGMCKTMDGPITYLENPYLTQNLAFSFQAQLKTETYFPGVTRKIYLKAWRYNQHLVERNMLIELGAQTNTIQEARNTCEIIARVLSEVLSGQ